MPGQGGEKAAEHGGVEGARADPGADCHEATCTLCGLGRAPTARQPGSPRLSSGAVVGDSVCGSLRVSDNALDTSCTVPGTGWLLNGGSG